MANAITGIRIVCALLLSFCVPFSKPFYLIYIIGGISDILDGIVAKHFGTETKFGATFDTVADTLFMGIMLIKVLNTVYVPLWLIIWIIGIAVIKCINIISGFVISKRFVSEHTALNKICGILLFAVPLYIGSFPFKLLTVLIVLTCVAATVAAIQEGYYIHIGKEVK